MSAALEVGRLTPADYALILDEMPAFWGERDLSYAHHPFLVHELAASSVGLRDDGVLVGYLFGFVVPDTGVGYVHLVGVRGDRRREGLATRLYDEFEAIARERGATSMKAITTPGNELSIGFHRGIGMAVEEVADYSGPGHDRIVFTKPIGDAAAGAAAPRAGSTARLDHVQVAIPRGEVEAARAFYGGALGLPEIERPESLGGEGAWYAFGRQELHLGTMDPFVASPKAHPGIEVDAAELDRLAAALPRDGWRVEWDERLPDRRRFSTFDPFGNRVELLAR